MLSALVLPAVVDRPRTGVPTRRNPGETVAHFPGLQHRGRLVLGGDSQPGRIIGRLELSLEGTRADMAVLVEQPPGSSGDGQEGFCDGKMFRKEHLKVLD